MDAKAPGGAQHHFDIRSHSGANNQKALQNSRSLRFHLDCGGDGGDDGGGGGGDVGGGGEVGGGHDGGEGGVNGGGHQHGGDEFKERRR